MPGVPARTLIIKSWPSSTSSRTLFFMCLIALLGWLQLHYADEIVEIGEANNCGCNLGRQSESTSHVLSNDAGGGIHGQCEQGGASSSCENLNAVQKHATESIRAPTHRKTKFSALPETAATRESAEDMVPIPGRDFLMGTDKPGVRGDGESPRRAVRVSSFLLDRFQVTNAMFRQFAEATGYRTDSEVYGWSFVFEQAVPPSIKAAITQAVLGAEWWLPVNGSYWREPEGPGTDVFAVDNDRSNLPVVQVSWTDANKFCQWRQGSRLPTEAEWELAARGTQDGLVFPWGNKFAPHGVHRANTFQGTFPNSNTRNDGFEFLAPVDAFGPQTEHGLYNMIGNAWEWVADWWTVDHEYEAMKNAEIIVMEMENDNLETHNTETRIVVNPIGPKHGSEKVKKGGSFLCHKDYCYRYRNAARFKSSVDSATQNVGFRCAKSIISE